MHRQVLKMDSLAAQIKDTALQMGYEKCGIIKLADMAGYESRLRERGEQIPAAKAFDEKLYRFADLQKQYPWAQSIVICVRPFGKYKVPEHLQGMVAKYYLFDSRRDERSREFQDSLKFEAYLQGLGLKTETERKFGITALRWAALKAGLGLVRRNNFFYTESGSWVNLEAWLIDRELEAIETPTLRDCPENCNRCVKACPTASLSQPYTMNPMSCVSFLTTFGGRDLPHDPHSEQFGCWVYGCDACQDVCPMNKKCWQGTEEFPALKELSRQISLEKILKMDYDFLEQVMQPKFWYIDKKDVWKWKVNAINVMVNNYQEQYKDSIYAACNDSHEKVREMARWAIGKLNL